MKCAPYPILNRFCLIPLLAALFVYAATPQAAERDVVEQAANLASAIVQQHPYLLDDDGQQKLDRINRALREALALESRSQTADERYEALNPTPAILHELEAMLSKITPQARVRIEDGRAQLDTDVSIQLPGDQGAIVIHVQSEEASETTRFTHVEMNCEEYPEHRRVRIEAAAEGTTWALLGIDHAPKAPMTLLLEFLLSNAPPVPTLLTVETPGVARLKVTALCDDDGEPTPAMIRLTWQTNGRDRKPPNAVAIEPLMDRQGRPASRRTAQLPGEWEDQYWCIPGPFDMEIPPGEWEIIIRRGVEHVPLRDVFEVKAGETIEKTYRPHRWIDMRQRGWYSGDEHVHARMQSDADAENLMAWVRAEDVHLSNVVLMGDIYRTWFQQRGWGPEFRVENGGYVLSPGQEDPRTHQELGHTIHMNTTSMVRNVDKYFLYDWVFDQVHSQGGLTGFCHVLFNAFEVHRGLALFAPFDHVDFIEVMQFNQMGTDLFYEFLNLGFPLTAAAGSDVPWGGTVGEVRMYAHLGDDPFSADAWFEAVRAGRTFVTNGPMLDLRVNDSLPGNALSLESSGLVRVSASALGHPDRFLPTVMEVVANGEVIHRLENEEQASELHAEFEWDAGHGAWIALRAYGDDGSQAHTTPVYAARPGFRFWKIDEAEGLIERRLASLDEVVEMAERYREEVENDPANLAKQLFVAQTPELLERVEKARVFYHELQETIIEEQAKRGGD